MNRTLLVAVVCVAPLVIAGCANNRHGNKAAADAGIVVMSGLHGPALGDSGTGNVVLGALADDAVGRYMDNQEYQLKQRLRGERAANILTITRLRGNVLKIGVANDVSFAVDSAKVSPRAKPIFSKIVAVLQDFKKTAIHVVGHADSTGSAQYNMKLSRRRALSVANFLIRRGVNPRRMLTWARGEIAPIASNATAAGRRANRRVVILIKPIIKGRAPKAFSLPPYLQM